MQEVVPLYRSVLGGSFDRLPAQIRAIHDVSDRLSCSGTAEILRGPGLLARLIATVMGMPHSGNDVALRVTFERVGLRQGSTEIWNRNFAGKVFKSEQFAATHRGQDLLAERFGPLIYYLRVNTDDASLWMTMVRHSVFGIPLPLVLAPRFSAVESVEDGLFQFSVDIALPLIGPIVRYKGKLQPDPG
jgi:hypothetical protein